MGTVHSEGDTLVSAGSVQKDREREREREKIIMKMCMSDIFLRLLLAYTYTCIQLQDEFFQYINYY